MIIAPVIKACIFKEHILNTTESNSWQFLMEIAFLFLDKEFRANQKPININTNVNHN